jgi:phage baseplate assembly protein gpV
MSFIDELAQIGDELAGDGGSDGPARRSSPRMRGLAIGRVVNLIDPLCLGRVQVRVPSVDGLDLFPFARVIVPGGSLFSGIYWIPNIEDEVLVLFEDGEPEAAYILGGVWSAIHMPPLPSPVPQIRTIRSPLGNQLVFTELPPALTIQSGPTPPLTIPSPPSPVGPIQTIMLDSLGIQIIGGPTVTISCGENLITIGPQGVSIATPATIELIAGDSVLVMSAAGILMEAPTITMTSAAAMTMDAGGAVAVTAGGAVAVTAGAAAAVTAGAAVTITAGAAATVSGAAGVLVVSAGVVLEVAAPAYVPIPVI